jgi:glycosyltransferase involved in cell wall biosynthesis
VKLLNVHNRHVGAGGSEVMFSSMTKLLRERGHDVIEVQKDNADLRLPVQKLAAFGSAIYSPAAKREMTELLKRERPAAVHVHNLFPQFSVSILDACRGAGVPVLFHVHDYKISCPTAQHLRNGQICTKCNGGREYFCAIHNCRGSWPMSIGYALRNMYARSSGKLVDGASLFLTCSSFVRDRLIDNGFPQEKCRTLNNFIDMPPFTGRGGEGEYIAYVGRISPEKGIDVLLAAAAQLKLPVKLAGDPKFMPGVVERAPANVRFVGKLDRPSTDRFLQNARMLVAPSIWWEAFGLVAAEAMSRELPVIASRTGGLAEVVDHNINGILVEPNDATALAAAMTELWDDAPRRAAMGQAGREKAERLYSPHAFYANLSAAYQHVLPRAESSELLADSLQDNDRNPINLIARAG